MNHEMFLSLAANPGGMILCYTRPNVQPGEKVIPNRSEHFTSSAALLERAAVLSSEGCDLYFTPALFESRTRKQATAKGASAVWIDVDVRDTKGFNTLDAALEGIAAFVAAAGIPMPSLVFTGGGYHCYWVCDTFLKPAEWEGCAKALHTLVKTKGGLMASDTARVTDIASMMRLPGFQNHKRGAMATVHSIQPAIPVAQFKQHFAARDATMAALTPPAALGGQMLGVLPPHLQQHIARSATPGVIPPTLQPTPFGEPPAHIRAHTTTAAPPPTPFGELPEHLRAHMNRTAPGIPTAPPVAGLGGLVVPSMPVRKTGDVNPISTVPIAAPTYAQLLTNCAVIRDMAQNPNALSEPAWKMALNIVVRCENGMEAAHEFSRGYDGYDYAETQGKAEAADQFGKPVTCATLVGVYDRAYVCAACQHNNKGVTPLKGATNTKVVDPAHSVPALELAAMTAAAVEIAKAPPVVKGNEWGIIPLSPVDNMLAPDIKLPPPPTGYIFGHLAIGQAGVFQSSELSKPVIGDLLWVDRLLEWVSDTNSRKVGYRINHLGVDGNTRVMYIPGDALDKRSMTGWLLSHGVTADVTQELTDYVTAACQAALRAKQPPLYIVSSYGWYVLGGKRVFISPTAVITEDGAELEIKVDGGGSSVLEVITPKNPSIDNWCEGYRQQFMPDDYHAHFFILTSLASAMFKIVEGDTRQINGMVVVMSGATGVGKSHTNSVCASVWGRWEPTAGNSTLNALPKEAASRRHVPVFVDDLTVGVSREARQETKNAILHYTLGREKSRLNSASKLDIPAIWRNVLFVSTNTDITSMLSSTDNGDAAIMRIVEVRMPTSTRVDVNAPHMNEARAATADNFGVLGNEFVHRLMRMSEAEVTAATNAAVAQVTGLLRDANLPLHKIQPMRMRIRLVAMCLVAAQIMGKSLPYDMTDTLQWAVQSLTRGEFSTGTTNDVTPHLVQRIRNALHRIIVTRQSAMFHWVAPFRDPNNPDKKFTVVDYKAIVPEQEQLMDDSMQVVTPAEYARKHNYQLALRAPSIDIIQTMDWRGEPMGFLLRYDMLDDGRINTTGQSARNVVDLLGTPDDGTSRVVKVDMKQVVPGRMSGMSVKYIYLTPDEVNNLGDD